MTASVARTAAPDSRESATLTAAVVGFVVALVTSVGVSVACIAYLHW